MGRFADLLATMRPASGKKITNRGTIVNVADVAERLDNSIDRFGQITTSEYTPIISQKPLPGLSFLRDNLVPDDGGITISGGEIRIDGSAAIHTIYTKDYGLYLPGLLGLAGLRARIPTPTAGTYRFGYGNDAGNRVGLENIDGVWKTFVESAGVRWYEQSRSNWLDPMDGTGDSGVTFDEKSVTLRIIVGWYGGLSMLFTAIVSDREGRDKLVIFDSTGSRDGGVTLEQPDLPIFAEASGGVMLVGGRQYGVFGRFDPQYRISSNRAVTKAISSTVIPIVSMRIKNATQWKSVPVSLDGETALSTVDAEYIFVIGGTLTGATFGPLDGIDASETALEMDSAATAISGGYRAPGGIVSGSSGNRSGNPASALPNINIPVGTVVTLAAKSLAADGSFTGIMRMRELW